MQKIFIRYLCIVISLALIATVFMDYVQQGYNARQKMREDSFLKIEQIIQTIKSNDEELLNITQALDNDYITKAKIFAYIIDKTPSVINDANELEIIKNFLDVDELHVIDENGILHAGTVDKYFGLNFYEKDQTMEFMEILDDPSLQVIQDVKPNGIENKYLKYVGVSRLDKPGIVQLGIAPRKINDAKKRNELSYVLSRMPVDEGCILFAVDAKTNKVIAHSNERLIGKHISKLGYDEDVYFEEFKDGSFHKFNGVNSYVVLHRHNDLILGIAKIENYLYAGIKQQTVVIIACLCVTYLVVIKVIDKLLKNHIVNGVHQIINDLDDITNGNLKRVVNVDNNPEFKELSVGINKMVKSILNENVKISQVIDMVDMPVGLFEFQNNDAAVMATERLRHILLWEEAQANEYYKNKDLFMEKIMLCMAEPELDEQEVYKIGDLQKRWVRIHINSDPQAIFGIVIDVTDDILEKLKIKHERDYDYLTGLCNRNLFKKLVKNLLSRPKALNFSAMVMMDLDYFKNVNDMYGHDWGDRYLCIAAKFLSELEGENAIASRRSGDEFCLFLYGFKSRQSLLDVIDIFYSNLENETVISPDGKITKIGVSSGIAWFDLQTDNFSALMNKADIALYDAKNAGRGVVCEYNNLL